MRGVRLLGRAKLVSDVNGIQTFEMEYGRTYTHAGINRNDLAKPEEWGKLYYVSSQGSGLTYFYTDQQKQPNVNE